MSKVKPVKIHQQEWFKIAEMFLESLLDGVKHYYDHGGGNKENNITNIAIERMGDKLNKKYPNFNACVYYRMASQMFLRDLGVLV